MKKELTYILFLALVAICFSCSKSPLCWGEDKNKGIIEQSVDFGYCNFGSDEERFIINSEEELDTLINIMENAGSLCEKPDINFNDFTLLGQYASGDCEVKFIREVVRDTNNKKFIYSIKIRDCGSCKKLGYSMNWILVPKLPADWDVEFIIKE
jgi:hypothetical protein